MTLSGPHKRLVFALLILVLGCAPVAPWARAQSASPAAERDGWHDFDWELGAWDTYVRVRAPLSDTSAWSEFHGVSLVQAFSTGRSNLVDLDIACGQRRLAGVSLRLYNPRARQWSLNFANMADGVLTAPVYGRFANGRGVFYGQDAIEGRVVLVRFVISDITANTARFVQSYSADGGRTWIDNWIAVDTRELSTSRRNER
jgi:hypothetical protein